MPPSTRLPSSPGVLVAAVVVAFLGALLTAATLYPTYRAPDEPAHVDQVRAIRHDWSVPGLGERQLSRQVVGSYPLVGYLSGVPGQAPPLAAADAPSRADRPSFDAIAPDEPTTLGNQMPQHPPLYYLLAAVWLVILEAGAGEVAFDLTVWWLRLLGVLLVAPLPWLAARTARHVGLDAPAVAGAAVGVLAVPMLAHVGSAVNNDVLLVLLAAVASVHGAAVAAGDLSVRRALWLGLATGGALLTKGLALALVPFVVGAVIAGWSRLRTRRPALVAGAVALGTALVVGGWWWVRNLLEHGTVQPGGAPSPTPPEGFVPDLGWWAPFLVGRLVRRWWIEPDTVARTTPPVLVVATAVAIALIVVALATSRRRRELGVLLLPALGCLAIVVAGGWRAYARTGIPFAIHGRYLYAGLVGLVVVAGVGAARLLRGWAPAALLAGAVLLQLTAAWWTLTFYWGIADVTAPLASIRAWLAWSPVPPVLTLAPVVLAATGVAGVGLTAAPLAARRLRE